MATSFFMSIQFPTIFTTSLRGLGNYTKSGSSFLVMAIVGGALIPPLMGLISDASSINIAMLVPAACFVVVALFGLKSRATVPLHECDTRASRAGPHRSRGQHAGLRWRGHRQSVPRARRSGCAAKPCTRRSPRACVISIPRRSTASDSASCASAPRCAGEAARARDLHQGGAPAACPRVRRMRMSVAKDISRRGLSRPCSTTVTTRSCARTRKASSGWA